MKVMYRKGPHITTPHFKSQLYPLNEQQQANYVAFLCLSFLTYQSGKIVIVASNGTRRFIGKVCMRALSIALGTE